MVPESAVVLVESDGRSQGLLANALSMSNIALVCHTSSQAALENCRPDLPGCFVLDLRMRDMNGLELQRRLAAKGCLQPFITISDRGDIRLAVEAMHQGAFDCLEPSVGRQQLLDRIKLAISRDVELREVHAEHVRLRRRVELLTPRERQILDLVASGKITKQISRHLTISPKTVDVHRSNIMRKIEVDSTSELIHFLVRYSLLEAFKPQRARADRVGRVQCEADPLLVHQVT
jgi:FixJ family two-component response regulator